jgi:hypothetical protein
VEVTEGEEMLFFFNDIPPEEIERNSNKIIIARLLIATDIFFTGGVI